MSYCSLKISDPEEYLMLCLLFIVFTDLCPRLRSAAFFFLLFLCVISSGFKYFSFSCPVIQLKYIVSMFNTLNEPSLCVFFFLFQKYYLNKLPYIFCHFVFHVVDSHAELFNRNVLQSMDLLLF